MGCIPRANEALSTVPHGLFVDTSRTHCQRAPRRHSSPLTPRGRPTGTPWASHVCPTDSIWALHGLSIHTATIVHELSTDASRILPMGTPRTAHGRSTDCAWKRHGLCPCSPHGQFGGVSVDIIRGFSSGVPNRLATDVHAHPTDYPLILHGHPADTPQMPHGHITELPILHPPDCSWAPHGHSVLTPLAVHALDSPWVVHWASVDFPWTTCGVPMDSPWGVRVDICGNSVNNLWTACRQSMDS